MSHQARATRMYALATAAAREAENGPAFIERAEKILEHKVRVLSGDEEAYFSALGIISGFHDPDGIVGDLGGGSLELVDILSRRKENFARNVTQKLLTFALGRGLEYYDKCAVDKIMAALERNDYRFSTLAAEIAKSDPFLMRRGEGVKP